MLQTLAVAIIAVAFACDLVLAIIAARLATQGRSRTALGRAVLASFAAIVFGVGLLILSLDVGGPAPAVGASLLLSGGAVMAVSWLGPMRLRR